MTKFELYKQLGEELGIPEASAQLNEIRLKALDAMAIAIRTIIEAKDPLNPMEVNSVAASLIDTGESIQRSVEQRVEHQLLAEMHARDMALIRNPGPAQCPDCGVVGTHICYTPASFAEAVVFSCTGAEGYDKLADEETSVAIGH